MLRFCLNISFVGWIFIGWLLTAFEPPLLVWFSALVVLVYICGVGTRAIALSSTSITALVSAGVIFKAWPAAWDSHVPYENIKLWSCSFLGFWMGAIVLVTLLALARERIYPTGSRYGKISQRLLLLGWGGLGLGSLCYRIFSASIY